MDNTDLRHHCYAMGYSDGEVGAFYDGYEQGRAKERERILKMVDWKAEQDVVKRQIDIHIDFAEILTTENVLSIIAEQLRFAMQKGAE